MQKWTFFSASCAIKVGNLQQKRWMGSSIFRCHSLIIQKVSTRACAHVKHLFGASINLLVFPVCHDSYIHITQNHLRIFSSPIWQWMPCFLSIVTHISFSCAVFQISPPLCWIAAVLKTASQHVQSSFACCKTLCLRSQESGHSEGWLFVNGLGAKTPARQQDWHGVAARQPGVQITGQVLGDDVRLGHDPKIWEPKLPEKGCSYSVHMKCAVTHLWKFMLDMAFEITEVNNHCGIDEIWERIAIAVEVYCLSLNLHRRSSVLHVISCTEWQVFFQAQSLQTSTLWLQLWHSWAALTVQWNRCGQT